MPEDCVLVSVWMGSMCCCPLRKGRSTSRWQASVLTSPSRLRAQLAPGHIKHLHSCAFWCLATGITKPHLRVSSPHGTGAKSPPEGCLAAGGGRGEGFSIGVFHQDCMFIGWRCPVGQHRASWVPRTLLGGVGRHPRAVRGYRADTTPVWNTKFWAICQWPEILTEFYLVAHAVLLPLVSFKGLYFCSTL